MPFIIMTPLAPPRTLYVEGAWWLPFPRYYVDTLGRAKKFVLIIVFLKYFVSLWQRMAI